MAIAMPVFSICVFSSKQMLVKLMIKIYRIFYKRGVGMRRRMRTAFFLILDIILVNLAYIGALALRFDAIIPHEFWMTYRTLIPVITIITILVYFITGFYRRLWEYASVRELYLILQGVTAASLLVVAIAYIFVYHSGITRPLPRSIYPTAWLLNLIFTGGSRFFLRSVREFNGDSEENCKAFADLPAAQRRSVLIIGAGDAGAMVVRELRKHRALGLEPVGFIDDDVVKQRLYLLGLPILGTRKDILRIASELEIEEIIIAMPSASGCLIREIVDICKATGARLKTLPGMYELIDGKVFVNQIREVQVEDLLGREPVQLDMGSIAAYLAGKVILVTGAGGSIGSELCRQIARFHPAVLVLLDNTENNLFEIEQELHERLPELDAPAELADVRDEARVKRIFEKYRPQVIFHAAAYKHVPMMERYPEHAVSNNMIGTYIVASTAKMYQAETFILVSTDKAVFPSSVMGATKRTAEMIIQYLNEKSLAEKLPTRYAAVRFGNVLGSRGSVLPTFKRQIARGGPVTVTHPDMLRYFMTIPEAVQLIIQAGALAEGGEIFVLDMGEPVRILDLARDLIHLSGLVPDVDIEIRFTGIRPGEKLREELFTAQEKMSATKNSRIFIAHNGNGKVEIMETLLDRLQSGYGAKNGEEALNLLNWLFPVLRKDQKTELLKLSPQQDMEKVRQQI
jgi:FlaA1/EpsC-like NDP-sugar epimerase